MSEDMLHHNTLFNTACSLIRHLTIGTPAFRLLTLLSRHVEPACLHQITVSTDKRPRRRTTAPQTTRHDATLIRICIFVFTYEAAISSVLLETVLDNLGCAPNWVALPNIIGQLARFTLHSATGSFISKPETHLNNIFKKSVPAS
jgi:hypothetical protein